MMLRVLRLWTAVSLLAVGATAFRVPISDTDSLREVCSGMWGGKDAYIEVSFDPASSGQVAMVIYEWQDVPFLGVETPESDQGGEYRPKTYICTTSAVRSNLCSSAQLGSFITSLPSDRTINSTSIYTSALKFTGAPGPVTPVEGDTDNSTGEDQSGGNDGDEVLDPVEPPEVDTEDTPLDPSPVDDAEDAAEAAAADAAGWTRRARLGRYSRMAVAQDGGDGQVEGGSAEGGVQTYAAPINYPIRKTGYYCVGIVPVTLVNERRAEYPHLDQRQSSATHAEYSGLVLFRNTFDGELPAVEYPKINFYLFLSVVYFTLGLGWGFLCWKHRDELLPMQYYISGTIVFLVIEMLAQFAYYRYINKHGGGASSIAFLFVIAILNAARNSLSFFLLLIVSMGLSVVTQSLGSVMLKVRILTGLHFIFGVLYSVGTVQVELDSAALVLVLFMIFPLAFTLTVFLMWIIVSLNGTILHLQARKQKAKLTQFQRLWRILVVAVIAIAAFFVVSSLSLSNRLDENYAPNNWKYRWILLDGSLGSIYLCVFAAIAWLWRPTANNRSFSMSQELAQDEDDADAEDYEIDNLEARAGLRPSQEGYARSLAEDGEGDGDEDERKRFMSSARGEVREENVVFQMGDDSDEEGEDDVKKGQGRDGYRDMDRSGSGSESEGEGDEAAGKSSKRRNS